MREIAVQPHNSDIPVYWLERLSRVELTCISVKAMIMGKLLEHIKMNGCNSIIILCFKFKYSTLFCHNALFIVQWFHMDLELSFLNFQVILSH